MFKPLDLGDSGVVIDPIPGDSIPGSRPRRNEDLSDDDVEHLLRCGSPGGVFSDYHIFVLICILAMNRPLKGIVEDSIRRARKRVVQIGYAPNNATLRVLDDIFRKGPLALPPEHRRLFLDWEFQAEVEKVWPSDRFDRADYDDSALWDIF